MRLAKEDRRRETGKGYWEGILGRETGERDSGVILGSETRKASWGGNLGRETGE